MNKIWFTSDLHLGHEKCAEWRGFKDCEEMHKCFDKQLRKSGFDEFDKLYHVGDLGFGPNKVKWLTSCPTFTTFIKGNHDSGKVSIIKSEIIVWQGKEIEIVHRPEDASGKVNIVIHGHIHKTGERMMPPGSIKLNDCIHRLGDVVYYNVNCEFHKYKPKLINEIIGEINKLK